MKHSHTRLLASVTWMSVCAMSMPISAETEALCATQAQKSIVADYYEKRPGSPPAIPVRRLKMNALTLATALEEYGTVFRVNADDLPRLWGTIDGWGLDTAVRTVFAPTGKSVIDIATSVPMTQPDDGSGFLDIYADHGAGVHGHLYKSKVAAVAVLALPRGDETSRLASFFDEDGSLIFAIYATMIGKPFDAQAIPGFANTVEHAMEQTRLCGAGR